MLHIIGLLLKIIGIILAVILGLLVLLVCIVLFEPVRYEVKAEFPGTFDEIKAQGKVSWLFHLISGNIVYEEGNIKWKLRLAWKKYGEEKRDKEEKEEKKDKKVRSVRKNMETEKPAQINKETKREAEKETKQEIKQETGKETKQEAGKGIKQEVKQETDQEIEDGKEVIRRKKSLWQRLYKKVQSIFQKIKYTFSRFCDKIKMLKEKKEQVADFIEDEVHRLAFSRIKKEMVWLRRFLKPKRLKAKIHFGFEEPYHTGQALAVFSMIYPFVGENMNIVPDFERRVLDGDFYIKGRLRAVHLVIMAWQLFWDKNVRATFREIKRFVQS